VIVLSATIVLKLHDPRSLKDKRQVVKSVCERVRNRFNVSIAEVDDLESWQLATLGLAVVSNDQRRAAELLEDVARFIERERPDLDLVECVIERV
jgi:uncharacterized protein YlxP (DUF503 family)